MKLSEIKPNPSNPRIIKDYKFEKLCKSIQDFPQMMELRPIVIDENNVVLGGNMRLKALQHLKFKDIPDNWVKQASELTEEQKQYAASDVLYLHRIKTILDEKTIKIILENNKKGTADYGNFIWTMLMLEKQF
jgi:arsenate reductase-like glutaredoxin family protein